MNIQSAINKEVFVPRDERMLVAVEVKRRKKKLIPFLPTGGKGVYATYICLSVTNKRPSQLLITKVKQFEGSSAFARRSQWTVEQLRQVNGINPNKDCPEFNLVFDNTLDEWVASSSAEKCIFIQILYHACQTYWAGKEGSVLVQGQGARGRKRAREGVAQDGVEGEGSPQEQRGTKSQKGPIHQKSNVGPRKTEFVNCQSKLTGDACTMNLVIYRCKVFFNRMKRVMVPKPSHPQSEGFQRPGPKHPGIKHPTDSRLPAVERASQALSERGRRLSRAEHTTVDMMNKAKQFADIAHKVALKYSK